MLDREKPKMSIVRQCRILDLSRSTLYYEPRPISDKDQELMRLIDAIYTEQPYYGARRIAHDLRTQGIEVGRLHVGTLMKKMGIEAIYPKRSLSRPNPNHVKYPYLLRNMAIVRVNQVWSTDITYIRLSQGFVYLVAVIDWYSRAVLSWRLSNTLEGSFCRETLQEALAKGTPEIFNTDQGSQFTDERFIQILKDRGISISMDGRGRALDNVFVERLWRTVKYEEVYLHAYLSVNECRQGLARFFERYNYKRPHQSLKYQTPWSVYQKLAA